MKSLAALPKTGFKFMLTVREGPDVGASYQLLPPRVSIGRGPECHVPLTDLRVSRNAAMIEFSMDKIIISDVSNRQTLAVNGDYVNEATLKDGDVIQIGETQMTFFVEAIPLAQMPMMAPQIAQGGPQFYPAPTGPQGLGGVGHGAPPPTPQGFNSGGLSKRMKLYLGVGLAVAIGAGLLLSEDSKKRKDKGIRTVEEIEKEIKDSELRQEEMVKKRVFKNDDEKVRFEEANKHFAEGFRDFQKGQWVRAMRSFETARAIDKQHPLAERYYKLAEKNRDEMIADLTLEARRYREKNMFGRCSAQFEKVLSLLTNRDDVKFKSAEALKKECDLQLEGRYRY